MKELLQRENHDAGLLTVANHRVGFSRPCLSVREDCRVETVEHALNEKLRRVIEHRLLVILRCENVIERIAAGRAVSQRRTPRDARVRAHTHRFCVAVARKTSFWSLTCRRVISDA